MEQMQENFIYWLENEYDYGKFNKPLKESSAKIYASGINTINNQLSLSGNGVYDYKSSELIKLRNKIASIADKDRKSCFEALIKFKKQYEENEKLKLNNPVQRQPDVLKRQEVERIAVNKTIDHFSGLGYEVSSKEKDNLGWDLEAIKQNETLKIEVKGLSGKDVAFELSPNEYSKSNEHSDSYVISVVTNSLVFPVLHKFRFDKTENVWKDQFGNRIKISEIIGARMRVEK